MDQSLRTSSADEYTVIQGQSPQYARCLAIVRVTSEFLFEILKTSEPRVISCVDGLPVDAKFMRMYEDVQAGQFVIVYEHPDFPETRDGDLIRMQLWPKWTQSYGEAGIEALNGSKPKKK